MHEEIQKPFCLDPVDVKNSLGIIEYRRERPFRGICFNDT